MNADDGGAPRAAHQRSGWSRRQQDVAAVLWPSFLIACAAAVLFFGLFDPEILAEASSTGWHMSRMSGYALGFLFLWGIALASSAVTLFLLRTAPKHPSRRQSGGA